jgi:hypothetical protein
MVVPSSAPLSTSIVPPSVRARSSSASSERRRRSLGASSTITVSIDRSSREAIRIDQRGRTSPDRAVERLADDLVERGLDLLAQ